MCASMKKNQSCCSSSYWISKNKLKPQISRHKETINIRAENNEMRTKRPIQRIKEMKSWFFKKITKVDKLLAKITYKGKSIRITADF
jgi:hypothetical protein